MGDPATYTDSNPVGTGPYMFGTFSPSGITLTANPNYWGGAPKIGQVDLPVYASNNTVLPALTTNQLDWAGNFLSGLQAAFIKPDPATHHAWFAAVQTNSLEPNLTVWPTNQLAVRQAISLAIDRTAISTQGEAGLEPVATNASGLVLPGFKALLSPTVAADTLSAHANPAAADKVLQAAGYVLKNGYYYLGNKEVTIPITDPSAYTDYAEDDSLVASELQKAHINATFVGQSATAWSADIASGKFVLSMHWSNTSIAAYQLYNGWLNSALATSNASRQLRAAQEPRDRRRACEARGSDLDRRTAEGPHADRGVRRQEPADHPDRLRRRVRRVQHRALHRLAIGKQPVRDRSARLASERGRRAAPQADLLTHPAAMVPRFPRQGSGHARRQASKAGKDEGSTMTTSGSDGSGEGVRAFPDGFLWGTATSAYQVEGGAQADGRGPSVWDTFSHTPGKVRGGDTGDIACDFYHRSEDDLDQLERLGMAAFRFSISWPRVRPSGRGAVNQRGIDFYRALVDGLLARKIEPTITLYHWDLPQSLEDEGGWANRDTAEYFAEYAQIVAEAIGDVGGMWITVNEPQVVAHEGYRLGMHAPGHTDEALAAAATHHLLLGHGLALARLRSALPDARVGITLDMHPIRTVGRRRRGGRGHRRSRTEPDLPRPDHSRTLSRARRASTCCRRRR